MSEAEIHLALLQEALATSKLSLDKLQEFNLRIQELVKESPARDHLYEVAGDIIMGVPSILESLDDALSKASLVASAMTQDLLQTKLPIEDLQKLDLVEKVATRFRVASFILAYGPPASELPGVKTVVSPKSDKNLPTDIDRESDSVLPPGSATPRSVKNPDGDQTVEVKPYTVFNVPDGSLAIKDRPRTLPEKGEEHGNPHKEDYNYVTRRIMDAAKYELVEKYDRLNQKQSGISEVILYDREAPNKEINIPSDTQWSPSSPTTWKRDPLIRSEPPGNDLPDIGDMQPPASGKVAPGGEGQFVHYEEELIGKQALRISELEAKTSRDIHDRANLTARLSKADPDRGLWAFKVTGDTDTYNVKVKALKKGNIKDLNLLDVKVSCDCNYFKWQGPEHHALVNGYLLGEPRGSATSPDIKDPERQHYSCKHILSALKLVKGYRRASAIVSIGEVVNRFLR